MIFGDLTTIEEITHAATYNPAHPSARLTFLKKAVKSNQEKYDALYGDDIEHTLDETDA